MHSLLTLRSGKGRAKALWSLLGLLLTFQAFATDYYVAKTGSITNDGRSIDSPFLTIQQAADVAHAGDVVYVREGVYREQVDLKSDGVTFRPYNGETVTLNGTDLMRNWTLTTGSTATYQTTMNWNVDTTWGSNQLFEDGRMIELARWPKQISDDIIMPFNAKAEKVTAMDNTFTITDEQFNEPAARWVGAQIWVNISRAGYDGQGWTGRVQSINGHDITVNFGQKPTLGDRSYGMGVNTEYFLFNPTHTGVNAVSGGVDALLSPGEWWKDGNTLYVKTRNGNAPNNNPNWDGTGGNVIEAKSRHFAFFPGTVNRAGYTIQDFHLFACAITTDRNAIVTDKGKTTNSRRIVEEAHDIVLEGLTVKYPSHQTDMRGSPQEQHYGWSGIVLSGRNNVIRNCDISLSATSALSIQGFGIQVLNNRIHHTNYMCSNAGAFNTGFICQDADIGYNKIWNTTVMAINFKHSKNSNPAVRNVYRIHHNEIFDFMRRSGDSGAIDMVGADMQWIRIDHNRIYNTLEDAKLGFLKHGIYLDFGSGKNLALRVNIDHNVIYEVNNPVLVNPGTDAHVFNNVLLSHLRDNSRPRALIINLRAGTNAGKNNKAYNNIINTPVDVPNPSPFEVRHNLIANGAELEALFVDAANHDYRLKPTATEAIDKGISVVEYMGDNYDEPVEGITDIGAYEWGTFLDAPDTEAPSVPSEAGFVVSERTISGFRLSWQPSTDNVGVAFYEVYVNGARVKSTDKMMLSMTELTPSTSYFVKVLAVDGSGNRSELSNPLEVRTTLNNVTLTKTPTAPPIDGIKEAIWSSPMLPIAIGFDEPNQVPPTSAADLSGAWTSLWDANNLYLFIDVNDDVRVVDSGTSWWNDDHVEIFIDADGSRPRTYKDEGKQYQYAVSRSSSQIIKAKGWSGSSISGIEVSNVEKPGGIGYLVEVKIPFATLGIRPDAYKIMGIDVQIGDDDDGGSEDTRMGWFSTINNVYNDPSLMGVAQLIEQGAPDNIKPSTPTRLKASVITTDQFTLNWNPSTDNIAVQSYEVFLNGNLVATPTTTSVILSELTEGTTYSVQVKAKDGYANLSDPSSVISVTTPTLALGVRYEAEEALLTGATSVTNQESGYSGSGYVQLAATVGASATFTVEVPAEGSYPVSLLYTGPIGNNNLWYYVNGKRIARTALPITQSFNNWSAATEWISLKTGKNTIAYRYEGGNIIPVNLDYLLLYPWPGGDSQAPSVPKGLASSNVTSERFTLNWNPSNDDSGIAPTYEVFLNGQSAGTTAAAEYAFTALSPGTVYTLTVKAVDEAGSESDASAPLYVSTSLEAEDAVWGGSLQAASTRDGFSGTGFVGSYLTEGDFTTFTLDLPVAGPYEVLLQYANEAESSLSVYVNGVKIRQTLLAQSEEGDGWATQSEILSLNAGGNTITYQYDSGDRGGVMLDHIVVSFSAEDVTPPTIPTALQASDIAPTGFTLNWTASTDNSGIAPVYEVYRDGQWVATTTATNYELVSLSPGTTYLMTVKAIDAQDNASDLSAELPVATVIDRTDPVGSGLITARGEQNASEGRAKAFDNDPTTKWLDTNPTSWVQFRFDNNVRHAVSSYTITSGSDVPARDPKNWKLYGTNAPNPLFPTDYVVLDSLSNVVFPNRLQKRQFFFSNTTEYAAYRLEITANNGDRFTQLSEIELFSSVSPSYVVQEIWDNIAGTSVSNIPVNTAPSSTRLLTSLEDPTPSSSDDEYNNFGQRIRGYIVPSTTATYYFYIASDNDGEFWLNTDEQPANKGTAPIARLNGSTAPREWTKDLANQKSAGMALVAGRKYYFEALMKESGGNNNLAIGWTTATNNTGITVIGNGNLAPYQCPTCRDASVSVESKPESKEIKPASQPQAEDFTLRLHPNPASREVSIDLSGFAQEAAVQINISDLSGKLFVSEQVSLIGGSHRVNLSQLPQGLFVVRVQGSKTARAAKLVVTK